jgi:hypothetical protein
MLARPAVRREVDEMSAYVAALFATKKENRSMVSRARVEAFVKCVSENRFLEAIEEFYAPDASMQENAGALRQLRCPARARAECSRAAGGACAPSRVRRGQRERGADFELSRRTARWSPTSLRTRWSRAIARERLTILAQMARRRSGAITAVSLASARSATPPTCRRDAAQRQVVRTAERAPEARSRRAGRAPALPSTRVATESVGANSVAPETSLQRSSSTRIPARAGSEWTRASARGRYHEQARDLSSVSPLASPRRLSTIRQPPSERWPTSSSALVLARAAPVADATRRRPARRPIAPVDEDRLSRWRSSARAARPQAEAARLRARDVDHGVDAEAVAELRRRLQ